MDACQRNLMALKKEAHHALDNICDSTGFVGLGLLTGTTLGGVIHALLVIAIIVVLIQVFQGRRRV
jgi:hypothetical protein